MNREIFVPENYVKIEGKANPLLVNLSPFLLLLFGIILFGVPFYFIWPEKLPDIIANLEIPYLDRLVNSIPFILIVIVGIIVHEMIHGIFDIIFLKNGLKSIKIKFKGGALFCLPTGVLKISEFKIILLMPLIIMGIIPALISLFVGNSLLLFFGIIFIALAGADIYILYLLLTKLKVQNNYWFENHPSNPFIGIVYEPKEEGKE